MKTIRQLAEEIGVSKTAISKKIDKLGLRKRLQSVGGMWLIPEDIENTIKNAFSPQTDCTNQSQTVDSTVDTLIEQLKVKDKQIEELIKSIQFEQAKNRELQEKVLLLEDHQPKQHKWFWKKKDINETS